MILKLEKVIKIKKIIVISEGKNTGLEVTKQLEELMGDPVDVKNVLLKEINKIKNYPDLILFTTEEVKVKGMRMLDKSVKNLVGERVIDHKNIKDIIDIKKGENVLLVNDNYSTAMETIDQLLDLGLDHIKYYPYYPGCISYPKLKIIITPGEPQLAPYTPETLLDIHTRILDIKTIYDISYLLKLKKNIDYSLVTTYIRDIVEITKSIDQSKKDTEQSEQMLEMLIDNIDYGIGFTDNKGKIIRINSKFEYMFGMNKKNIINNNIKSFICNEDDLTEDKVSKCLEELGNKIVIKNNKVSVEIKKVGFLSKIGYIIYLKEKTEFKNKAKYEKVSNDKLYNFSDYLSKDNKVLKMLKHAKKFAKTESTILIEGENGTGKEILAQAIHMNSYRKDKIFVPINMTTISSNLLESELFGYEEGTFTGALKGGKLGLFEVADGGTIFIDEIGDVPISVQSKLLRVLEEKKIRRVGSVEEKSINVRIIAATNKKLLKLVEKGKFRMDLFFRLSILPIYAIPLRNRKEDINYLLKHFINNNLLKKIDSLEEFFEKETIEFLNNYRWIGNVRELTNLVEYLLLIYDNEPLGIDSLHDYMKDVAIEEEKISLNRDELWVLGKLYEFKTPLGRIKLRDLARDEDIDIGEGQIRRIIESLKEYELIDIIGNRGSLINKKGKQLYG